MSRLVEVPLASGGSIAVEVDDVDGARTMRGGGDRGADLVARAGQTLEQSLGAIAPALHEVLDKLRSVSPELAGIEVELGLKLTGEAGMVIAKAGAEANFRVLVRWQRATETSP